jgi:condensin complex subunit 2
VSDLISALAPEPSDYSYFNSNMMRTWAGPEHWKMGPKSKSKVKMLSPKNNHCVCFLLDASNQATITEKKSKDKAPMTIDYKKGDGQKNKLKKTRAATTLVKSTLERYSKGQTTLPEDIHYDSDQLFKPFVEPDMPVSI